MKAALITPFLNHLPFHPSTYLGYGAAVLGKHFDLDVIDLNAEAYADHEKALREVLYTIENRKVTMDTRDLRPLYHRMLKNSGAQLDAITWSDYDNIFITAPSWFVTVPTQAIISLADRIRRRSPHSAFFFYGNSLGTWTDKESLKANNIQIRHLNDLFNATPENVSVDFDTIPTPIYKNRDTYLFDMLPFRLKHGCSWGHCRFCSLAKGWNASYLERSVEKSIEEVNRLVATYSPKMLVCRDNSINGNNLIGFCRKLAKLKTPWIAMARADLSNTEIEALQKSNCRLIYFGLESGSDRVLNDMNKGISSRQMSDFIKSLHRHHIIPVPSLFVGSPGETEDDFEKTVQFLFNHQKYLEVVNLYPLRMTPGSEYTLSESTAHKDTLARLNKLIQVCEDLGIKVCIGEQSAEYHLFRKIYPKP